jgi:hypothetical protein
MQRSARSLDGGIDFGASGFVHASDDFVVDRIDVGEGLAGGDPLAVDEVLELFHVHLVMKLMPLRPASQRENQPAGNQ